MNTTTSERERTPLVAADLSAFAKALRTQLAERIDSGAGLPGHVEMLNLLARAAGHRNVQALKAAAKAAASGQWNQQVRPQLFERHRAVADALIEDASRRATVLAPTAAKASAWPAIARIT